MSPDLGVLRAADGTSRTIATRAEAGDLWLSARFALSWYPNQIVWRSRDAVFARHG
jgi:hypothetical protein